MDFVKMVLLTTNLLFAVPARNFSNPIIKSFLLFFCLKIYFFTKGDGIQNHYLNSKLDFFLF